ncbi:Bgt-4536 [Blumeria graminis f. sp. tritici]|uniref:Bgt-4536 n=2 Tax=Blumeria graminis f. sp. tritici TaxID=62690 RepID=A0A061HFV2_BLUGR|nr:ER protein [Blumeria graminis f. sp. tritici 96224]VCU39330.1 Bgt-4536 [Blumeria graminis f. sp. tritici]
MLLSYKKAHKTTIIYGLLVGIFIATGYASSDFWSEDSGDGAASTTFNGVEVPPLPELNGMNFTESIKDGYWFVKHYSPWCSHCQAVAPIWQTLYEFYYTSTPLPQSSGVQSITGSGNTFSEYFSYHFGSLDCDAYGSTCRAQNVNAYPTFIIFKKGVEINRFEGGRDMKQLSDIIENQLETIRPGSRPVGGPKLPKVGAKEFKDTQKPNLDAATSTDDNQTLQTSSAESSESKIKAGVKTALSTHVQPSKPQLPPNPLGTSISLSTEKFQHDVTMSQDPWFIKFFAPWCGHCQAMSPNWVQLSKEMKGKLNVGEVNCEVEKRLCKDVHIRGYPTILFFRGGERVEYDGLRGLGDLLAYANKAIDLGTGVKTVDAVEFKKMEETEEVIFVYFYDHATTSEDFAALERLTLSLIGHAKLVKTNSQILVERFRITSWPRLLVSRDGRPTYYTALAPQDMRDFRRVLHWMQSVWLPIVPELTASNSREIMEGKLIVLAILSCERKEEFAMAKKELKSAALEWMDKQTIAFQRERQELRDAKQLRIEEAEDRNDQRALRAAKNIHISMDKSERKEVGFAWVDGVFWERWIRQTYGIEVAKDGEKVVINDEDNRSYWDTTITGNAILASRTSILETIPKVVSSPPKIKPKSTISKFEKVFFDLKVIFSGHPFLCAGCLVIIVLGSLSWGRGRARRNRGGFLRLDDKDKMIVDGTNGKVD